MSEFFKSALEYVLTNEGGFVDNEFDPGGVTKFGITKKSLSIWSKTPATYDDIRNLKLDTAAAIYETFYWNPIGCHKITQYAIACALFDTGVLYGVGTAAIYAQRTLVLCGFTNIIVDGQIGPKSVEALNSVDPTKFIFAFSIQLSIRVADIIKVRPESIAFKKGWENRIKRLETLLA